MIKLSASLVKDILSCSMKGYYRINSPELAEQTREMMIGTIVHSILETNWMNRNLAALEANKLCVGLDDQVLDAVNRHLDSFFENFRSLVTPEDLIENKFLIPLYEDVVITGKIDRMNPDLGLLIDWKTGSSTPMSVDNDIQFLIYHFAYKQIVGKEPSSVLYVSLPKGSILRYNYNPSLSHTLFGEILPKVVRTIRSGEYAREGLYGYGKFFQKTGYKSYTCRNCSFLRSCMEDM